MPTTSTSADNGLTTQLADALRGMLEAYDVPRACCNDAHEALAAYDNAVELQLAHAKPKHVPASLTSGLSEKPEHQCSRDPFEGWRFGGYGNLLR
jgi:hypothetical protein